MQHQFLEMVLENPGLKLRLQQKEGINNETRKLDRSRFTQMQADLDRVPETARYHRSYWTDCPDRSEKRKKFGSVILP